MRQPLRPMNLGEILDRTFQIYKSRFWVFVGIAALPALVMMGIELANQFWWQFMSDFSTRRLFLWFTPKNLAYSIALAQGRVLFCMFVWPAYVLVTARTIFAEPVGLLSSLSECFKRWGRWIGLTATNWSLQLLTPELVVTGLLIGAVALMFEVLKMNPDDPMKIGPLMFLGSLVLGFAAFEWAGSMIALSTPAWTIEEIRIGSSLRRALKLSKGSRWRIVMARVLPLIVQWTLAALISETIAVLLFFIFRSDGRWWFARRDLLMTVGILVRGAVATLVGPICPIALTLIYYDQRIRKEGYDIEQMMQAAGWTADGSAIVAAQQVEAPLG